MFHKDLLAFTKLLAFVMIVSVIILGIALFNVPTSLASELNDGAPLLTDTPTSIPTATETLIDEPTITPLPTSTPTASDFSANYYSWVYESIEFLVTVAQLSTLVPTNILIPTDTPTSTPTETATEVPPTPTITLTPTVPWTCVNPLNDVTISHPTVDIGDTFTIDRDIVQGTILDREVVSVEQDEAPPVVELVNAEENEYRALRAGSVTMTVNLTSEEYCSAGGASGYYRWVYGSADVIVTISQLSTPTPTDTPVPTETPAPIFTPSSGCEQPLEDLTIDRIIVETEDIFTIDGDVISFSQEGRSTLEFQIDRVEQSEDLSIIAAIDEQENQYHALHAGSANIHVVLSVGQYCWFWDETGVGVDYWTMITENSVVQVEVTGSVGIAEYVIYLPLIQN